MTTLIAHVTRVLATACLSLSLAACGGALAYQQEGTVYAGGLGAGNNVLVNAAELQSIDSFNVIEYAIERGGVYVGVARTQHATGSGSGAMQLDVHDFMGAHRMSVSQLELAQKIDAVKGWEYHDVISSDAGLYFMCFAMGAADQNNALVLLLQLVGGGAPSPNVAVLVDVASSSLEVLDAERFDRNTAPQTIVPRTNPLKGNTIEVVDGVILLNGDPVTHDGTPVQATSVKHHFR